MKHPRSDLCRETLVLASGSASRQRMLQDAGLRIIIDRPDLDEAILKRQSRAAGLDAGATAEALAKAKAELIWPRHPGEIVLAADQMLDCEGDWFDKPEDRAAAARQIARLQGRSHRLISAAVLVRDGEVVWRGRDQARLTLRPLDAELIDRYLDLVGDRALESVGCYQVEGPGIQLFQAITGDLFTIQGLPLLPLLAGLRDLGVLQ